MPTPIPTLTPESTKAIPIATNRPELLAPAGDRTCLVAAVENGADAVYFGVQGHNARARASNFDVDALPEVMDFLHRRGVRGYLTMNTLVFPREWDDVGAIVEAAAKAGVDALIVQDIGLARLVRAVAPEMEIHASTQMSITSGESVRLAQEIGCTRVILARELSIDEIARVKRESTLPVEVFVHGALCVAYSGQCLTSEALGGRSANRGECAQACRMPYQIVSDGVLQDLDTTKYLLSPQDLAAFDLVPRLAEVGVASLKIEGRLKTPEYVANITRHYRLAIDQAAEGKPVAFSPREVREMELSFSRGFSHGFLDGNDHKVLVRGDYAKKRGVFLGHVEAIVGGSVRLNLASPVKPGDGLVFDGDGDEDDDRGVPEQGGRVYEVRPLRPARGEVHEVGAGPAEIGFGRRDVDLRRLRIGQRVWKTDDPELTKRLRKTFEGPPRRKVRLDVAVVAEVGRALAISGRTATGRFASVRADAPLVEADRQPADVDQVRTQIDRLGDTLYELGSCEVHLAGGPLVPKSLLNGLRRELVEALDRLPASESHPVGNIGEAIAALRPHTGVSEATSSPELIALCRTTEQVEAAIASGVREIQAEFQDIKRYPEAVLAARGRASLWIATPRIQKPGEANIFKYLARLGADGLLVRNPGGLYHCVDNAVPFIADFSLNASNELTLGYFLALGALRVTASYDLDNRQLEDLISRSPVERLEVVIHQRIPMFHMEHCVFCAFLSPGTDATNCGRPCDIHDVRLRDRVGIDHPLKADVGCRNTLFHAIPQTAAEYLPRLIGRGLKHFRVEFLDDDSTSVRRILGLYQDAIAGRRDTKNLWRELKATNQYGVTRGQLAVIQ